MVSTTRLLAVLGCLALGAGTADADILRCKDGAGLVTYTQGSCPAGTQAVNAQAPEAPAVGKVAPPPQASAAAPVPGGLPPTDETPECPATLAAQGSDADVRACAKSRSLPSTPGWAQLRDRFVPMGARKRWTGDYLCLKFVELPQPAGGVARARPLVTVSAAMRGESMAPGFESPALKGQVFPTKVAAVEALCAARK